MSATAPPDLAAVRGRMLDLAIVGDRRAALREAVALLEDGISLPDFVLGVLAPIQSEVGLRWERGQIAPAEEHLATDLADTLLTIAAGRAASEPSGLRLVVCVADNEHHNLPARMVAELLRAEGHAVTFLGTPSPHARLGRLMSMIEPDAVVISCSLAMNLPGVVGLAGVAHEAGLPVVAGGAGFSASRAGTVGADHFATTIAEVADLARSRTPRDGRFAPGPNTARVLEWSDLARRRRQLSVESAERLLWNFGPIVPRTLRSPRTLQQRFADLMPFVESAALVEDQILIDYGRWLAARDAGVLRADPAFTAATLTTVRDQLDGCAPLAASAADLAACLIDAPGA